VTALAIWGGVTSLLWLAVSIFGLYTALRFVRFKDLAPREPERYPRLSVVIAACNEEEHLESALSSLLAQDYPDLEIVLVNDRSTDGTGRVVDALAARDSRILPIHVAELPEGWLGKVHAVHRGTLQATGEFLLFTDADVHFKQGALKKAVAHVVERGIDHFVVAPELVARNFWQEVAYNAFATGFMVGTRAVDVGREGSDAYVGVGAFNLVRRTAFDRTPGFEWLKMEVLDDVGLGLMLQRAGAKGGFTIGLGEVEVEWYASLRQMVRGLEKNAFGAYAMYQYPRLFAFLAFVALVLPGPVVALAQPYWPVRAIGIAVVLVMLAAGLVLKKRTGRKIVPLLLGPLGFLVIAWTLIRSAYFCWKRGGIVWRGTLYPIAALRKGLRVRLGGRG
jgi:glycosyltransferase involved in cell wall biosynthesis